MITKTFPFYKRIIWMLFGQKVVSRSGNYVSIYYKYKNVVYVKDAYYEETKRQSI